MKPSNRERIANPKAVRKHFIYDPATGIFGRKVKGKVNLQVTTAVSSNGYRVVSYGSQQWLEHRLIWAYMTGEWPEYIDHIDGDRLNNRWDNLRSVSKSVNNRNSKRPARALPRGVYRRNKKYIAQIRGPDGACEYLGTYPTPEEAATAYRTRALEIDPMSRYASHVHDAR